MTKTKQKKTKFYSKASWLLSRSTPVDALYELESEYEISKEEIKTYIDSLAKSKAVSSALTASREEKDALYEKLDEIFIQDYPNIVYYRRGENIEYYEYKDGVYTRLADPDMFEYVDALMAQYHLYDYRTSQRKITDTVRRVASLLSRTPNRFFKEEKVRQQKWYLNLKNGLLDIETITLKKHTPKYFSTVQVPFEYDPDAEHPLFDTFIQTVSNNDESTARMIKEMFGYCLTEGNPRHKVFYLYGDTARNGKSTTAKLICGLIGWGNVSTLSLAQIANENSSAMTAIVDKQINFSDELSTKYIESPKLTSVSAEAMIEINPKFKHTFLYPVTAKFIITCNDLPHFKDSQGMKHRMISIPFTYQFKEEERILRYEEVLLKAEGSGILNWALEGMQLLNKENVFSMNEQSREDVHENLLQTRPVVAFLEERYTFDKESEEEISADDMYGKKSQFDEKGEGYCLFCEESGVKPLSIFKFRKQVSLFAKEHPIMWKERVGNKNVYRGICKIEDNF